MGGGKDLEKLWAAVYADPDDDAPRLVLADALMEVGDPRGELIALQLRPKRSASQLKRERHLRAAHGRAWLGPLAAILRHDYAFERGFLAKCRIRASAATALTQAADLRWTTVRELGDAPAALAVQATMRSLRVLSVPYDHDGRDDGWHELLVGAQRHLEVLDTYGVVDTAAERWTAEFADASALPRLRVLVLRGRAMRQWPRLFAAPIARRLEALELHDVDRPQLSALAPAIRSPPPRLVVAMSDVLLTLECDRAMLAIDSSNGIPIHPTWDESVADSVCALLALLPRCKLELALGTSLNRAATRRIRAAARARG